MFFYQRNSNLNRARNGSSDAFRFSKEKILYEKISNFVAVAVVVFVFCLGGCMFSTHLCRRSIPMPIPILWRPSIRRQPFSKIFIFETAWPLDAKFYVEPSWEGGTKFSINGPGHLTKMAATPI